MPCLITGSTNLHPTPEMAERRAAVGQPLRPKTVNTMRTRSASTLLISMMVFGSLMALVALLAATPAKAASGFDGTYDLTTTGKYGTYTEHNFLIISNGKISDAKVNEIYTPPPNWPAGVTPSGSRGDGIYWYTFIGTVSPSGSAGWVGGSLVAAGNFDYTYTGVINADGTGSGTWYGNEHGTWSVQKSGSSSLGLSVAGGMAPAISVVAIGISIVAIGIASTSVKAGFQPQVVRVPSPPSPYEPSVQTTTDNGLPIGPPEVGTPVGGAGLQYATPAPVGKPFPPREHYSRVSQEPPRCPIHGTVALQPHFSGTDDPGSWFCPMCRGYPWGRN